jgi:uncharacterized protein YabE (DUF348 family)
MTYDDVVRFTTTVHNDENRPSTYRNTAIPGRDGLRRVTDHLIYVNGILIHREEASWQYIEEPVNEQIVQGTGR